MAKPLYLKQDIIQAAHPTLHGKYYADACVTLNARTVPAAFVSLISLVLRAKV